MENANIPLLLKTIDALEDPEFLNKKYPNHQTVIYKAENKNTGDFYIGATGKKDIRLKKHIQSLEKNTHNKHGKDLFQKSFNKDPNFIFTTVPVVDRNTAFEIEKGLIKIYKDDPNCLNMVGAVPRPDCTPEIRKKISDKVKEYYINGGVSPHLGKKLSEKRKEEMSEASKKLWKKPEHRSKMETFLKSPEFKEKISILHSGKTLSSEHIEKLKLTNTGLKRSQETKDKISASQIGKIISPESIEKTKQSKKEAYLLLTEEEKLFRINRHLEMSIAATEKTKKEVIINNVKYESISEAGRQLNRSLSYIHKQLNDENNLDFLYSESKK
jgi:hypothetical protein